MNKKLIIFGVAILLIFVGLSGCTEQQDEDVRDSKFRRYTFQHGMILSSSIALA